MSSDTFPRRRKESVFYSRPQLLRVAVFAQGSAVAPDNPISESEKRVYAMLGSVVIAAAEKMPEESYPFKPTPEVRSFGQLVGHLADSNYYFCSAVSGETKPASEA